MESSVEIPNEKTNKCIVISGCPEDNEEEVPSEEIEFDKDVALSFVTFYNMNEDIESNSEDEQNVLEHSDLRHSSAGITGQAENTESVKLIFPAPVITADIVHFIGEFCDNKFYREYIEYFKMVKNSPGKGETINEKIETVDKEKYERIKKEALNYLKTKLNYEENPNNPYIFEMLLASEYLDAKLLRDVSTAIIQNSTAGKNPEEIAKIYNIHFDDLTEQEKAEAVEAIRKEHKNKIFIPEDTKE